MPLDPVAFGPDLPGGIRCELCSLPVTFYDTRWLHDWPGDESHEPKLPRQKSGLRPGWRLPGRH